MGRNRVTPHLWWGARRSACCEESRRTIPWRVCDVVVCLNISILKQLVQAFDNGFQLDVTTRDSIATKRHSIQRGAQRKLQLKWGARENVADSNIHCLWV